LLGGIFEVVGYGFRAYAHFKMNSTTPYAVQSLLLLLGPILFAASIYMFLGRVIRASGLEHLSPVPVRYITKIFVAGDCATFGVQAVGGGVLSAAKKASLIPVGNDIILAGLVLQVVIFFGYVATTTIFHLRLRQSPVKSAKLDTDHSLVILYGASLLITLRNVYRILEYALGQKGYLVKHEWALYAFDAAPMILVMIITMAWYWSDVEPGFTAKDSGMEMQPKAVA
jgi:hypothetical protein